MIKKFRYLIEFILLKILFFLFLVLPLGIASKISGKIFRFLGSIFYVNKIAIKNCKIVLPNLNSNKIKLILHQSWENLGSNIIELSRLSEIINEQNKIKIEGLENIKEVLDQKKQAIFFGIHQSNWEICVPLITKLGVNVGAIYRHVNNYYIEKLVYNFRISSLTSQKSFYTPKGAKSAKDIITGLKKEKSIFLLIDQKDSAGEEVKFFGKNVKTQLGFLKIARKHKLPMIGMENKRLNNGSFLIKFKNPIYHNDINISDKKKMHEIHLIIEKWILENPSQWFWQHKRFN